jgi:hypothetical protein
MHVAVREIPPSVQSVLKELGYGSRDIEVQPGTKFTIAGMSGDGYRAFWCIVNLETGKHHIEWGSWGGPNMFNPKNPVDLDETPRTLPPGAVVIEGTKGGGHPVYARIIAHPENLKLLSAPKEGPGLTDKEKSALNIVGGTISSYRADSFARAGLGKYAPTNPILQSLAQKGLVRITGVGVQITTAGKNMRSDRLASDRVASRYLRATD